MNSPHSTRLSISLLLVTSLSFAWQGRSDDKPIDFSRDVLPILQAKCVSCHGDNKQESGLRLDSSRSLRTGGDNYMPLFVPGRKEESPLYQFVSRDDADLRMPPKGAPLSSQEIATLGQWIDQGAKIPDEPAEDPSAEETSHWSFQPIRIPSLPDVLNPRQSEGIIDRWIQVRLDKEELPLQPFAPERTLARRLWFDLIGLPPDLDDIHRLANSPFPDQYEREVDRLLSSPRFGERWARHWLDVVRFAETNGFEMNQPREKAWPYRDYVIESANIDRPFDEFVKQQLAGDALGADEATGFLVGGPWDQVKSPDPGLTAQQRADELHDMVSTTGSAFLGLTVGCARCHRHKFDPISQTDYYRLKATFEGVKHGERALQSMDEQERARRIAKIKKDLEPIEAKRREAVPLASSRFIAWLDAAPSPEEAGQITLLQTPAGEIPLQPGPKKGGQFAAGGPGELPTLVSKFRYWNPVGGENLATWKPPFAGRFRVWVSWGAGRSTHASDVEYWIDRDGDLTTSADQTLLAKIDQRRFADNTSTSDEASLWSGLKSLGDETFGTDSRLLLRASAFPAVITASAVCFEEISGVIADAALPSLRSPVTTSSNIERFSPQPARYVRMTIEATNSAEPGIDEFEIFSADGNPRNVALASAGAKATASSTFAGHHIHQLAHLNDGQVGNEKSWISAEPGRGQINIELPEQTIIDTVVWGRDQTDPPRYIDRIATKYKIETSIDGQQWNLVASSLDRLPSTLNVSATSIDVARSPTSDAARRVRLLAKRKELIAQLRQSVAAELVYAGTFENPAPTMRFHRGDPLSPREAVAPGTLTSIGPKQEGDSPIDERQRRLTLASWLTAPNQPLTWRVIANRLWQQHFGEGIVATPSDLGRNGLPPTHPELIDLLANELAENQYSLKHLHRLMVTSRTYRQSSDTTTEGLRRDAGSRLLWRYPPRRLDAEPLRDTILAVAGNLNLTMGGPGFSLFEPNDNYVRVYRSKQSFGPAEWRRMIYQTKIRMQLDDTFGAFDCPDAGQIAPRRSRSITPLQALNLLHSRFILEQANLWAEQVRKEVGDDRTSQVNRMFEQAFQRLPDDPERHAALRLVESNDLPTLARALFNANEFLMID
jgi:cytochrome c553